MKKIPYITDEELEQIRKETSQRNETEPRLNVVRFDPGSQTFAMEFKSGADLKAPLSLFSCFKNADPNKIANAKIVSHGSAVHWDELDVQMTTVSIINQVFGIKSLAENARKAGRKTSPAKTAAARANGAKGGRPRKKPLMKA